ncbi:hypothetical protein BC332_30300 [Capsicum chinense]|nr:hypothetical protein BC332_30300 [Capsicum chinense]
MIESNKECDVLCAMFSECNLVGNPREWWIDSGSTCHVCTNKELFSSFALAQVEEMIYMANFAMAKLKDNVLDLLTKGLSREGVERTSKGMGLRPRINQHGSNST